MSDKLPRPPSSNPAQIPPGTGARSPTSTLGHSGIGKGRAHIALGRFQGGEQFNRPYVHEARQQKSTVMKAARLGISAEERQFLMNRSKHVDRIVKGLKKPTIQGQDDKDEAEDTIDDLKAPSPQKKAATNGAAAPTKQFGAFSSTPAAAMAGLRHYRVDPKVMIAFDKRLGAAPRKIEIERKRKEYASVDPARLIVKYLINETSTYAGPTETPSLVSALPLHIFDNEAKFEVRDPLQWISGEQKAKAVDVEKDEEEIEIY